MKKVLLIAAVAAFAMTSCKKDRTCECTLTDTGYVVVTSNTQKSTKKGAKAWCEASLQRIPEYTDAEDKPYERGASQLGPVNTSFGRKFKLTAFRWLSPDEI